MDGYAAHYQVPPFQHHEALASNNRLANAVTVTFALPCHGGNPPDAATSATPPYKIPGNAPLHEQYVLVEQVENAVLVAVSQVIAPVAEQILAQMRQRQAELAILQRVFHVLTEDETIGVPVFHGDVQRLNAKDARMKPVAALRDQLFALDPKAGQDRAKEAAGAWRKWRTALCRDSDASAPELPA